MEFFKTLQIGSSIWQREIGTTKLPLTPIPMDEAVASLSAILLDEDYYRFIHSGKLQINDLSILSAAHLIPIKT